MEKILEFTRSEHFNDSKHYRFQCDCLTPRDAMDIEVEDCGERKWFSITMHYHSDGLINKLKDVLGILRGDFCWREFIVRHEDAHYLADIFNPGRKYDDLP